MDLAALKNSGRILHFQNVVSKEGKQKRGVRHLLSSLKLLRKNKRPKFSILSHEALVDIRQC